jgi:hypothetical protein
VSAHQQQQQCRMPAAVTLPQYQMKDQETEEEEDIKV